MKKNHVVIVSMLALLGLLSTPAGASDSSRSNSPQDAVGKDWQWVGSVTGADRIEVNGPARYTMNLLPDGKAQFKFDCNRGGGAYEIGKGTLKFGPMISTRMACPEDSLDARFMGELSRITSFYVEDGMLYLMLAMDSGTMRFRPAQ